jgi:hypothetical protein
MDGERKTTDPAAVSLDVDLGDLRARALAGTLENPCGYVVALLDVVAAQISLMQEARNTIALADEVVRVHGGEPPPPAAQVALRRQALRLVDGAAAGGAEADPEPPPPEVA